MRDFVLEDLKLKAALEHEHKTEVQGETVQETSTR